MATSFRGFGVGGGDPHFRCWRGRARLLAGEALELELAKWLAF